MRTRLGFTGRDDFRSNTNKRSLCESTNLDLFQEKVALHKAVAEESPRGPTVLQKAGWVWPSPRVGPHQLTVMGDQGLGDLWAREG